MTKFDTQACLDDLSAQLKTLATTEWSDYKSAAIQDGTAFLQQLRDDIQKTGHSGSCCGGELTQKTNFAVADQRKNGCGGVACIDAGGTCGGAGAEISGGGGGDYCRKYFQSRVEGRLNCQKQSGRSATPRWTGPFSSSCCKRTACARSSTSAQFPALAAIPTSTRKT